MICKLQKKNSISNKKKIFVAGHNGLVGSSIYKNLKKKNCKIFIQSKKELDLRDFKKVKKYFQLNKFNEVYLCAAKVGGIISNNNNPATFYYDNILIQTNVIHCSMLSGVKKLMFLGSSCIYPGNILKRIQEKDLMCGKLEQTNFAYAISKISGIKMCEAYNKQYKNLKLDYRSVIPTNVYGENDNYDSTYSHVIPGLINKFIEGKKKNLKFVTVFGTGKPLREFIYSNDLAKITINLMNISRKKYYSYVPENINYVNVGTDFEISIKNLAIIIKKLVGFKGTIYFDHSKPDGTYRKLLSLSLLKKLLPFKKMSKDYFVKTLKKIIKNRIIESII
jgi:GDP-L-fucose synthase